MNVIRIWRIYYYYVCDHGSHGVARNFVRRKGSYTTLFYLSFPILSSILKPIFYIYSLNIIRLIT